MKHKLRLSDTTEKAKRHLETEKNVNFMYSIRIPMHVGIELDVTVNKPKKADPTSLRALGN